MPKRPSATTNPSTSKASKKAKAKATAQERNDEDYDWDEMEDDRTFVDEGSVEPDRGGSQFKKQNETQAKTEAKVSESNLMQKIETIKTFVEKLENDCAEDVEAIQKRTEGFISDQGVACKQTAVEVFKKMSEDVAEAKQRTRSLAKV
ncbi:hypothetical protein HDU67_001985 [Dinochytrium kinnereticum]|nr:hypothetical protein HDU67_001985 [Dinochytrium kinnereticum]